MASSNTTVHERALTPLSSLFLPTSPNSGADDSSDDAPSPRDSASLPAEKQLDHRQEADTQGSPEYDLNFASSGSDGEDHDIEADWSEPQSPTSEDGFGNKEVVDVAADAYTWKIDHSSGHHRLRGALLHWANHVAIL